MDGLNKTRARIAVVVAVFGLALLMQGSLLALADQPMTDTLHLNETNAVYSVCDFPLVMHEEGAMRTSVYFNQNGQVSRVGENWQGVHSTLTNPANGRSLSYHTAGHGGFTIEQDGGLTVYTKGLQGIMTVPGYGAISGQAGNVTIRIQNGTFEVHRSGFLEEGDFSLACSYLEGTAP
jgi:hypothetical protein